MRRPASASLILLAFAVFVLSSRVEAAQPQLVSVSPSSGSGLTQTFTLTVSDSAGASDIAGMNLLINTAFSGTNACWFFYDHIGGQLYLASDDASQWNFATSGAQNTQCYVQKVSSSDSGNNASVAVSVTFGSGWLGAKTIWARAGDRAGADSGYQQMGTFTATTGGPAPDFSVSMTPSSQSVTPGNSVTYNVVVTSQNGFSGNVSFTPTPNPQPSGLIVSQTPVGPISVPANGTGTGTIQATTSTGTPPGNVTITVNFQNGNLQHSFQVTLVIAPASTPNISINPSSGSGSTKTFTITATDQGGYHSISGINILINSSFSGANGCWFYYQPFGNSSNADGTLSLASDDTSTWTSTGITSDPTTASSIHNSQCTVFGGPTTVVGTGTTLTITLSLTFSSSFAGAKTVYLKAADKAGPDTGYQQKGTWTVVGSSGSPDYSIGVSPSTQSVTGQATAGYSVIITPIDGFSGTVNLGVSGLPPGATLTPPSPIAPGQSTQFFINTTASTPPASYTLTVTGTNGSLSHSTQVTLVVQAAGIPTLAASPSSGSGSTQTFTFTATDSLGFSNLNGLNVLFNANLDGKNACWMYYDYATSRFWLASDDASAWSPITGTNATVQNSQCSIPSSSFHDVSSGNNLSFQVTITFTPSFAGAKTIFMRAVNKQGGDTGYQVTGSWTVP